MKILIILSSLFCFNLFAEDTLFLGRSNQGRLETVLKTLSIEEVRKFKNEEVCNERCWVTKDEAQNIFGSNIFNQSFYVSNFKGNVVEKVRFTTFRMVLNQLTLQFRLFGTLDYKINDKNFEQDYLISSNKLDHKRMFPKIAFRKVKPLKLRKFDGFPLNAILYSFANKDKTGKDFLFTRDRMRKAIYTIDKDSKEIKPFLDPHNSSSLEFISFDKENSEITLKRVGFQFREYVIYNTKNDTFKIVR
jgi:bisphosphoglycerate-independent phosphoglycerate mutase (AlkP superfamily)